MIPFLLLRAWWNRFINNARNWCLIRGQPVITYEPLPFTHIGCWPSKYAKTKHFHKCMTRTILIWTFLFFTIHHTDISSWNKWNCHHQTLIMKQYYSPPNNIYFHHQHSASKANIYQNTNVQHSYQHPPPNSNIHHPHRPQTPKFTTKQHSHSNLFKHHQYSQ